MFDETTYNNIVEKYGPESVQARTYLRQNPQEEITETSLQPAPTTPAETPADTAPNINDYLRQKYQLQDIGEVEDQAALSNLLTGINQAAYTANRGTDPSMFNASRRASAQRVKDAKQSYKDAEKKDSVEKGAARSVKLSDPDSEASKTLRDQLAGYGIATSPNQSAQDLKDQGFTLAKAYKWEQDEKAREDRRNREAMERLRGQKALEIEGYGTARNEKEFLEIREGIIAKKTFDAMLDELIQLRKYFGTEFWNRKAVRRAKQIGHQLVIDYKKMAGLGVLSKADYDLLNSIIPANALQVDIYEWWDKDLDPTLNQLEKLKSDSTRDFQMQLGIKLEGYNSTGRASTPASTEGNMGSVDNVSTGGDNTNAVNESSSGWGAEFDSLEAEKQSLLGGN